MSPDSPFEQDVKEETDVNAPAAPSSTSAQPASADGDEQQAGADAGKATTEAAEDEAGAKRGRPRKQSSARKTRTVELTLTLTGTAEGEWQADLVHGTNRVVKGLQIPASAVAKAAKELHDDISEGIETVLSAAREQHRAKMEALEAELEKVKRALADLSE
ncbi:hypothetical protein LX83_006205 [Goodfellowiella coeruleoviolacea]|uniref:Mucin n=1 Tax=Goodfellowiella coeruleoviolacea TaxID=334858 RepID=A0AAE3GKT1_9PSEU|nr:hypothetical protein [Goodfellowiella coeruleoviolacea]